MQSILPLCPTVYKYDEADKAGYIAQNMDRIYLYLHLSMRDRINRFSPLDPSIVTAYTEVIDSNHKNLIDVAELMVEIRKTECEIRNPNGPVDYFEFRSANLRMQLYNSLYKITEHCHKIMGRCEPKDTKIQILMQNLIMLMEALPRQNLFVSFYITKDPSK